MNPATVVRVQRPDDTAFELTASGVRDIDRFFPVLGPSRAGGDLARGGRATRR